MRPENDAHNFVAEFEFLRELHLVGSNAKTIIFMLCTLYETNACCEYRVCTCVYLRVSTLEIEERFGTKLGIRLH
jgi:hypothetical protein